MKVYLKESQHLSDIFLAKLEKYHVLLLHHTSDNTSRQPDHSETFLKTDMTQEYETYRSCFLIRIP